MADGLYTKGIEQMGLGSINFESDTIQLAPMAVAYTPNYTTESFWSDVSASLAAGASRITLSSVTWNIDSGNSRVELDATDVSEASQTFTTDKFVILKWTGTASTSPLVCCLEFTEGTLSPVNGTFGVTVNAQGFYSIATA